MSDGKELIILAKKTIRSKLYNKELILKDSIKEKYSEELGVFVTLNKIVDERKKLRGCIGFIEPIYPLWEGIVNAAFSAAFQDPRFKTLSKEEFKDVKVEISVLTKPKLIKVNNPKEYPEEVIVGRDGLIVEKGEYKGLLLPQVATDYHWDSESFLGYTCEKAGLAFEAWKQKDVKVYSFQVDILKE